MGESSSCLREWWPDGCGDGYTGAVLVRGYETRFAESSNGTDWSSAVLCRPHWQVDPVRLASSFSMVDHCTAITLGVWPKPRCTWRDTIAREDALMVCALQHACVVRCGCVRISMSGIPGTATLTCSGG